MRVLPAVLWSLIAISGLQAQGNGVVEGRLVNATDPKIVGADVELDVVGLGGGMSIIKSTTSDKAGKFRIDGLPTDQPLMIRANYKMVNYHSRVAFDASGKASAEIRIFEPTSSMEGIRFEGVRMAFHMNGDQLRILEHSSFNNETKPPKSFMSQEGNFRFFKVPGIPELPRLQVTGPGSSMPLAQSPLESPDGTSYYSLYPLRPGITNFEIDQTFPYQDRKFIYRNKFYYDLTAFQIGVIPQDLTISGEGLRKIQSDAQKNFAVYSGGPIRAGTEVVWTISGGTPAIEPTTPKESGESRIKPMPTGIGQNALMLGSLLLACFLSVLWYAHNYLVDASPQYQAPQIQELKNRRNQLVDFLARLENRYENQALDRRQYFAQREPAKRQLRRIVALLVKSGAEKKSKAAAAS